MLTGNAAGTVPFSGTNAAVESRGRFYTDSDTPGRIAIWDSTGVFLRNFGRSGAGPGELEGRVVPYIGPNDRLYVRSQNTAWTAFDSAGAFLSVRRTRLVGQSSAYTIVLDDGGTISSEAGYARVEGAQFILADTAATLVRSFGSLTASQLGGQPIVYAGGETFWTITNYEYKGSYRLEEWDTTGVMRRRVVRAASWLPTEPPAPRTHLGTTSLEGRVLQTLHMEPSGLLIVGIWISNERRLEILDPDSGLLLATATGSTSGPMPVSFFRGRRTGYRLAPDSAGIRAIEIISYSIVAR
jgi:hypothetical protein